MMPFFVITGQLFYLAPEMNTHRHTKARRRAWVQAKADKTKKVAQILEEAGISRATLYTWIEEFKAEASAPPSPKKKTIAAAESAGDEGRYDMLKAALAYTDTDGGATRKIVSALMRRYTMSVEKACAIAGADASKFEFRLRKPEVDDALVHAELSRLLAEDPDRSFEDCYALIRTAQPAWSRKQIRRIYRDEQLYRQRRRKRGVIKKEEFPTPIARRPARLQRPDATWHIGVIIRQQAWTLFIVDTEDNAVLNKHRGRGLPNEDDIRELLEKGRTENGRPRRLRIPGVPPFNQRPVTAWAWEAKIAVVTLSMGKEENIALQSGLENLVLEALPALAD